ncbi:MAG: hypothetical protein IRY97_05980 [Thermomicrobiaceae bacterium]|nr:hypothetical protein [Thermomicrobiaceae bacterium]
MIGYLVLAAIVVAIGLFVMQPLLEARAEPAPASSPARLADLRARRAYLIEALRDVDFDYSMGKVGRAEYEETRARYVREAALVLRELERESARIDAEIEREIAQLREAARRAPRRAEGSATES